MSLFTPAQTLENYCATGCAKAERAPLPAFLLAVLAGALIALGGAASATATYAVANPSLAKLISGLLFPFGLAIVILSGAELFTGNCLITLSVLDRKTSLGSMLRSWAIVYLGNFVGAAGAMSTLAGFPPTWLPPWPALPPPNAASPSPKGWCWVFGATSSCAWRCF